MLYSDYLKDKFHNAIKLNNIEGVPCILNHSKGKDLKNYEIYGNSYQATRSGKNLLSSNATTSTLNGVTLTYDNGTITLNGTCDTSANFDLNNIVLSAGTYTLSANANKVSVSNDYAFVQLYDSTNSQTITLINSNAMSSITTTISDGTFLYRIRIDKGTTYDNVILKPQLEKGSTATEYEPYGVSPSPDYPSEVQSVGDLTTKNLFNTSDFVNFYTPYWTVPTEYGYHDEVGEECLKVYGTVVAAGRELYYMENRFKENTPYTFSLDCYDVFAYNGVNENAMRGVSAWFAYTDGTKDSMLIEGLRKDKKWVHHKVTSNANKTVQGIRLSYASGNAYSYLKNIQLEEGTTATEYEPYHKYDIPITVTGKNLLQYPYKYSTRVVQGITFTDNGDGTIMANGTATARAQYIIIGSADNYTLTAGEYTISGCPSGGGLDRYSMYTSFGKEIGNGISKSLSKNEAFYVNITIESGVTVSNLVFKPQLELGTTATAYEPYKCETTHIYLDEPLRKVGDYADYIDFENRKVVRNVKELIFDGISEGKRFTSFNSGANNRAAFFTNDFIKNTDYRNTYGFTNYFQYEATVYNDFTDRIGYVVGTTSSFFKFGSSSIITDIISANEQLANWNAEGNPLKFYYPLATPTEEPISLPTLKSFKGTSIMSINTSIQPSNIKAKYIRT